VGARRGAAAGGCHGAAARAAPLSLVRAFSRASTHIPEEKRARSRVDAETVALAMTDVDVGSATMAFRLVVQDRAITEVVPGTARSWSDRFAAFAARKTTAVLQARPSPYVTVVEHPADQLRAIGTPWSSAAFGGSFYVRDPDVGRPVCSLVFVRSADGNTVADDPASLGGGATDYHVVYEGLSRVLADAVLVGARTVNSGSQIFSVWHPEMVALRQAAGYARHPTQIVATRRGLHLDRGLIFNAPDVPVILLTDPTGARAMHAELASRPWIRLAILKHRDGLPQAFAELSEAGIQRISCIGGRSLVTELLTPGLVDDLYLTTAARPGGAPDTPLPSAALDGDVVVEKRGTGDDEGVVFQHIQLQAARKVR
jgi:riboflavin biosynthesis pyrimidine reductase